MKIKMGNAPPTDFTDFTDYNSNSPIITTIKIKYKDLEKFNTYFTENITNPNDRAIWYYFLCQKPNETNLELKNFTINSIYTEKYPANLRFINYLHDIDWDNNSPSNIKEAKKHIRFWISGDSIDLWESLLKIIS